jgi:hypothetical protein
MGKQLWDVIAQIVVVIHEHNLRITLSMSNVIRIKTPSMKIYNYWLN